MWGSLWWDPAADHKQSPGHCNFTEQSNNNNHDGSDESKQPTSGQCLSWVHNYLLSFGETQKYKSLSLERVGEDIVIALTQTDLIRKEEDGISMI